MLQFVHLIKAQPMNESADMLRNDDGLVAGHSTEGFTIQVVKMGVCYENQVYRRQVVDLHAWLLDALDHFEPTRPVRIYQHAVLGGLNEERGVPDPCDANLSRSKLRKDRFDFLPLSFCEERRDYDLREKVPLVPTAAQLHIDMVLRLASEGYFSLDELPDHA